MLAEDLLKIINQRKVEDNHFLSKVLKEYELVGLMGSGQFSTVAKAKRDGKNYAIKFILNIDGSMMMSRSFIRELTILRQLTEMYKRGSYSHSVALH